jgi:large repetitive protein
LEENFDRFNFEIHKEKEMVSFRRCILALTVLALFAGLASAQVQGQNQLTCATNVSVTPTLRSEGYTEQTGDITLNCTGGITLAPGSQIPAVNMQIFLNTAVTSRLLPQTNVSNNISEALILIDEPGSGLPGYGPSLAQKVCGTPLTGCTQYVGTTGATLGTAVDSCTTFTGSACTTSSQVFGANVFQGVVSGNSVTFFGIPVLAPVTAGASRVYRITNIRANASALSGGSAAGATPVIASISISGATSLLITNPTPTIGFVQAGLTASASSASNFNQCTSATRASVNVLTFSENFGTAFKTRVAAQSNTIYAGQISTPVQNVPGSIYNSESNLVVPIPTGGGMAGLADYGTRLKASFNNIPAGIRLWVSTSNVNNAASPVGAPAVPGGSAANTGQTTYVQLVSSETVSGGALAGTFPAAVSSTDTSSTGTTPIVEIPVSSTGTASAVWEVVNTNPNAIDSFKVAVYVTYSANVAQNSPPAGTATVNLSFAPTPTAAFSASAGAAASSSLPIPRFIQDTGAAKNIFNINICRTVLLYPYVTNTSGYDTGIAIANTTSDPFGTGAQSGSCKLNWYQGTTNPPQGDTGNIAAGTVWANLASIMVPAFGSGGPYGSGYMIAVCNFQFAHGFAVVQDLGGRNFGMSYLALVIPDPGTGSRKSDPLNYAAQGSGENTAH